MKLRKHNINTNKPKFNGLNGLQKSKKERINNGRLKDKKEESKDLDKKISKKMDKINQPNQENNNKKSHKEESLIGIKNK